MIDELRDSLYTEFPDSKGKIYIYNHLSNDELKKAETELGVSNLAEKANKYLENIGVDNDFPSTSGRLILIRQDDREVYLAMGWNPKKTI